MNKSLLISIILIINTSQLFCQTDQNALARQYIQNGETQKAVDIYQKLFNNDKIRYYNEYCNGLVRLNKFSDAIATTKGMIQQYSEDIQYPIKLGQIYQEQGDTSSKNSLYSELIQKMPAEEKSIQKIASGFQRIHDNQWAINTYLRGRELLKSPDIFSMDLGHLYRYENQHAKMIQEYLTALEKEPKSNDNIKRYLASTLDSAQDFATLKTELEKKRKAFPENEIYADLSSWQYLQQNNYKLAIETAINLLQHNRGTTLNLFKMCRMAINSKAYDAALTGFQYLITLGKKADLYKDARIGYLKAKYHKITDTIFNRVQLEDLEKSYKETLDDLGSDKITASTIEDLANLQAYYLKKPIEAEKTLTNLINIKGLPDDLLNRCKLELGDLCLLSDKIWDATLLYSQVEKANKDKPIGLEAAFRNAKLAYYTGDFKWAKEQLKELTAKTTEYIDNDALNLSLMINGHTLFDSTGNALKMYARADFQIFKGDSVLALKILDSIDQAYPLNDLKCDVLIAKARIFIQNHQYRDAIAPLKAIIKDDSNNIWADDAVYMLGDLYKNHLNDEKKAKKWFQMIITNYSGSLWINQARKNFRILRGDAILAKTPK